MMSTRSQFSRSSHHILRAIFAASPAAAEHGIGRRAGGAPVFRFLRWLLGSGLAIEPLGWRAGGLADWLAG